MVISKTISVLWENLATTSGNAHNHQATQIFRIVFSRKIWKWEILNGRAVNVQQNCFKSKL